MKRSLDPLLRELAGRDLAPAERDAIVVAAVSDWIDQVQAGGFTLGPSWKYFAKLGQRCLLRASSVAAAAGARAFVVNDLAVAAHELDLLLEEGS